MISIRQDLNPYEDDNHTYPTLLPHGGIREMTGSQRRRLKERGMTIEERVSRLEGILREMGKL